MPGPLVPLPRAPLWHIAQDVPAVLRQILAQHLSGALDTGRCSGTGHSKSEMQSEVSYGRKKACLKNQLWHVDQLNYFCTNLSVRDITVKHYLLFAIYIGKYFN